MDKVDRTERLINLVLYLLDASEAVTADRIRLDVYGYDPEAADDAFLRMFERDKDDLRDTALPIEVAATADGKDGYRVDRRAYHLPPLDLAPAEMAAARLVAGALDERSGFVAVEDLKHAVLKLASRMPAPPQPEGSVVVRLAADAQSERVRTLYSAVRRRKAVTFTYETMSTGETSIRTVEPYGLFYTRGAWYLVGRDRDREALRTFRVTRMHSVLAANKQRPHRTDFEVPADFDVGLHGGLPWEIGERDLPRARVWFDPAVASLAEKQVAGSGRFMHLKDGSAVFEIEDANEGRLVEWVLGFAAQAEIVAPAALRERLASRFADVASLSGSTPPNTAKES
jgi:proteasome accessory factor B